MKKLIYVVKRGRKIGIYDEWKKCYEQTNRFSRALYRSFPYKTELEKEDENKEGSLRYAFMLAEKYMSDFDIGGFKLVYQGEKKDYLEEDSWKKEGFLPFGEEIPDDADNLEGEGENDGIDEKLPFASSGSSDNAKFEEAKASFKQLTMHAESIGVELKNKIIGQDEAIDKLERAFFHAEKRSHLKDQRKGPRNVYLFAGPPGVGKTFMAQEFADKLGLPFRRFDMSGYSRDDVVDELTGISVLWKKSKPGVLTDYVKENPCSVLLFDEIEKASDAVIMLFLQILDDGTCFDRHYDANVSFKDTIIIFTTNAGKQRYRDAEGENLTALPDKLVLEALEKDINPATNRPYFPPEMLSRLSSHTVIMLNHLRAEALRRVVEQDVETHLKETEDGYGYHLSKGKKILAQTVLYSMGGSADARNASRLAGKLIDQLLYEFMTLMMENTLSDNSDQLKEIEWSCDFTGATEEVKNLYSGEKNCVIPVLGTMKYKPSGYLEANGITVKATADPDAFMEAFHSGNVLFAVIDYALGMEKAENILNIADAATPGRKVFLQTAGKTDDIPVYILCGGRSEYEYSDREKNNLMKRGARGFINQEFYADQLEAVYRDVCCQRAMDTLTLRHQILTYKVKKVFDDKHYDTGKIEFCDLKLETAVESEDRSILLTDDLRPQKSWEDVFVPDNNNIKEELTTFISYLKNQKEYVELGMRAPKGVLLYGPPRTGKTSLAKVVASESNVNFLTLPADKLRNMGSDMVHHIFRVARKYAPTILFIDEIDAIGANRASNGISSALNALLEEMDGFVRMDDKPVFVMAATNLKEALDPALIFRFDINCYVPLPNKAGREWMLNKLLNAHSSKFCLSKEEADSIADRSEGMSLADLENVFDAALRENIRSGKKITYDLFDEIFEKYRDGEEREISSIDDIEHTACHEAGHAIVELYYGRHPRYISVVARDNYDGYVEYDKLNSHPTKERLLQVICRCLGGRAAEMEFGYGITPGASRDLEQATGWATAMVCQYGMYEDRVGLAVISREELVHNEKAKDLINEILSEQMKLARQIIAEKKDIVEQLVAEVMSSKQKYLTEKDILRIYEK